MVSRFPCRSGAAGEDGVVKGRPFRWRAGFALAGLRAAWRLEASFRTHVLAALGALGLLVLLRPPAIWWALVILVVALILAAELFNTALEHLADHLHPEEHPTIKIAKDCAAAAVLVLSLAALGLSALMLWQFL